MVGESQPEMGPTWDQQDTALLFTIHLPWASGRGKSSITLQDDWVY